MKSILLVVLLPVIAFGFWPVAEDIDSRLPVYLESSGSAVTSIAFGDTTVQYCMDGDSSWTAYTDDADTWVEVGNGYYWLYIGASEFSEPNEPGMIRISGGSFDDVGIMIRTQISVSDQFSDSLTNTVVQDECEDAIDVKFNFNSGNVLSHLTEADDNVIVDINTADLSTATINLSATTETQIDDIETDTSTTLPASIALVSEETWEDANAPSVTSGNVHAHLKAADDNVVVDPNTTDIQTAVEASDITIDPNTLTTADNPQWSIGWLLRRIFGKR